MSFAAVARPLHSPIICLSALRWHEAGRLRHLMSRFARDRDVFFLEQPVHSEIESLQIRPCPITGVQVVIPRLPLPGIEDRRAVLDLLLARSGPAIGWYATPEAMAFSGHVSWLARIYDCAEEPSPAMRRSESRLMLASDLVFTSHPGLHADRRELHPNIHCFPDGLDEFADAAEPTAPFFSWDTIQRQMAAMLTMAERNAGAPSQTQSHFGPESALLALAE